MQFVPQTIDATGRRTSQTVRIPYPLFFALYGVFAIYFYVATVAPYLATSDLYAPRILADAITYESICVSESNFLDLTTLRDIGPCIGLRLFSYDSGVLSIFNAALMLCSILWVAKVYERPWQPLLALAMVNPITFLSIFGPNKEVFGFAAFAALAIFIRSRSLAALGVCLVMALFTRLPTLVITAAYCLALVLALPRSGRLDAATRHRYHLIIVAMIVAMSLVAALFSVDLQYNILGDFSRTEDISQSTTLSLSIDGLSRYGLYTVVYAARFVLNMYSGMIGSLNLWSGEGANYYTVGVAGSSIIFLVASLVTAFGKRPDDLDRSAPVWNMILFIVMFTLVICLSPVIQHRYFYPIYVFLLLFVVPKSPAPALAEHEDVGARRPIPAVWAGERR